MYKRTRVRRILEYLRDGLSVREIARILHVSRNTISRIMSAKQSNRSLEELLALEDDVLYEMFFPEKFDQNRWLSRLRIINLIKRIYDIPLNEIDPFPEHPFKVRDDEDMLNLDESVRTNGVIAPATVRKKEDGRYEVLSGHRRMRACELAGIDTLKCEVVDMTRDEGTIFMVESNFQRTKILPSEKAFAYNKA